MVDFCPTAATAPALGQVFFTVKLWVWLAARAKWAAAFPKHCSEGAVWLQTLLLDEPSPNSASNPHLLLQEELVDPTYNGVSHCRPCFEELITPTAYFSPFPWTKPRATMECDIPIPAPKKRVPGTDRRRRQPTSLENELSHGTPKTCFSALGRLSAPCSYPRAGPGSWVCPIPSSQPCILPQERPGVHPYIGRR